VVVVVVKGTVVERMLQELMHQLQLQEQIQQLIQTQLELAELLVTEVHHRVATEVVLGEAFYQMVQMETSRGTEVEVGRMARQAVLLPVRAQAGT
jgi:endonuclease V-like protein UPF0215 family